MRTQLHSVALGGGYYQIGIARARFRRESGPARSRFLVEPRIFRDFGRHLGQVGIVTQIVGSLSRRCEANSAASNSAAAAMRRAILSPPVRRTAWRCAARILHHEIAHRQHISRAPRRAGSRAGAGSACHIFWSFPDWANRVLIHPESARPWADILGSASNPLQSQASVAPGFPSAARYLKRHAA